VDIYCFFEFAVFKSAGEYLLVAGLESKDIYVFAGKEKKWEKKLDYSIINANINSAGYVTVLHKAERDKSAVSVYNKQGVFLLPNIGRNLRHLVGGVSLRQGGSDKLC